jgi:hypothetical protein
MAVDLAQFLMAGLAVKIGDGCKKNERKADGHKDNNQHGPEVALEVINHKIWG